MGKGGEKATEKIVTKTNVAPSKSWKKREHKLESLPTEELRKWAKAYGLVDGSSEESRDKLVQLLVSPQ